MFSEGKTYKSLICAFSAQMGLPDTVCLLLQTRQQEKFKFMQPRSSSSLNLYDLVAPLV